MIGVFARSDQIGTAQEFFELFKTPWEFCRPGQAYEVVITTTGEIPQVNPRLLLIFGPGANPVDSQYGIVARGKHQRAVLKREDTQLPVYGQLATFAEGKGASCLNSDCGTAGLRLQLPGCTVLRLGYDLFDEVRFLLLTGQPVEFAHVPTLDLHIRMLRNWILQQGIPLLEIPPSPMGHSFTVCLTHDIDFVGIRHHRFDHTMFGFLFRSTVGAIYNLLRGRLSAARLLKIWRAVATLPFVYLGWAKDFWEPFAWYLSVEQGLGATYFLIPFKHFAGENVPHPHASRRASSYDVSDLARQTELLRKHGCELAVHGIDAWQNADRGREELARLTAASGASASGIRMHWLLHDANTFAVLEQAGYAYDATCGYNETVGYRAGTAQVFRPLGVRNLLELPLHIQDGALFFPERLDLPEAEAQKRCQILIDNTASHGGVLTLLWHDRSHGPERFWGDFYARLLQTLKSSDAWFGTAGNVVDWFRKRRDVQFERVQSHGAMRTRFHYSGQKIQPPLRVRVYAANRQNASTPEFKDILWNGESADQLEMQVASSLAAPVPNFAFSSQS